MNNLPYLNHSLSPSSSNGSKSLPSTHQESSPIFEIIQQMRNQITISIEESTLTIKDFKQFLVTSLKQKPKIEGIRIICNGRQMRDDESLATLQNASHSKISVILSK